MPKNSLAGRFSVEPRAQGRHKRWGLPKLLLFLLGAFLFLQSPATAQIKETRRVLIFNDLGSISSPGYAAIDQAILAGLEKSPYQVEFYNENLEVTLFPDEASQRQFREWYALKYHDHKPDVIITVGQASLKFMIESHEMTFPNTPIIFCGSTEEMLDRLKPDSHFTGVWAVAQPEKTLKAALHLQPATKHVVVVGGVGPFDRFTEGIVKKGLRDYESTFDFTYLTDLGVPTLLERLRHLPSNTIVFHTSIMQDAVGARFIDATQSVPMVASAANAPVFVLDDVDLGRGSVGGDLLSWAANGQLAAEMAVRILNGENPQNIPIVRSANVYMFDWRALQRWGLKESDLPPGSIVLNRQSTGWESYKSYIIGGISLIVVETLLILGLVWQRARRREAEARLAITYDRLRLAVEAGRSVGRDWDIKSGRDQWFGDLETVFGIPSDSYSGHVEDFRRTVHPEDRELVEQAVANARQNRKPYAAEFRVVRTDGTVRWITARGKFYYALNGDAERMLGMAVDITDRKLAEAALADVGRRLIEAHEEERAWIARELHDDINQRVALLAIDLERYNKHLTVSKVEARDYICHVRQSLFDLGKDIQALSHRLHSSKLEYLGLAVAVGGFCKELSEQQKVEINFSHAGIPGSLPKEISLCLFRVLQEALQNAVKHSGEQHFKVELLGTSSEIQLTVNDQGVGFDKQDAFDRRGLGLISMRERLQLVEGEFSIESRPGCGTTIRARVPLMAERHRASAAG